MRGEQACLNGTPSCNIPSLKRGQAYHQRHEAIDGKKGDGRLWGREAVKLGATLPPRRRLLSDQQCSVQLLRRCLLSLSQFSILCNAQQTLPLVVDVEHREQTCSISTKNGQGRLYKKEEECGKVIVCSCRLFSADISLCPSHRHHRWPPDGWSAKKNKRKTRHTRCTHLNKQ